MDKLGGIAYYKVIATPEVNGELESSGALEQIVIVDRIGIDEVSLGDTGCMMMCDLGVYYSVVVYRVSRVLDVQISSPSDPVMVRAGDHPNFVVILDMEMSMEYAYNSSDFVRITTNVEPSPDAVMRVFAFEFDSSFAPIGGYNVTQQAYLIHEGPVHEVLYRVRDKSSNDKLTVVVQIRGKLSSEITSKSQTMDLGVVVSKEEHMVVFSIPESNTGWPGREITSVPVVERAVTVDGTEATITVLEGHGRQEGDWVYIDNSTITGATQLPNGWYEVFSVGGTEVKLKILNGSGSASGTCDIAGNAQVLSPTQLLIRTESHLQGLFAAGNKLQVGNSTNPSALPDDDYVVSSVATTNRIFLVNSSGSGTGYCDVVATKIKTLYSFTLGYDAILSQVVTSSYEDQKLNDDDEGRVTNVAKYIISTSAGDKEMEVTGKGKGRKMFEPDMIIPAGSTITLKLERSGTLEINASTYKVFMYFKKAL